MDLPLGRFLVRADAALRRAALVTVLALAGACGGGPGPAPEGPPAAAPILPALERGTPSPAAEAAVAGLLSEAREALASGRLQEAVESAAEVTSRYPEVQGSSEALWIEARAAWRLGEPARTVEAARRFAGLLAFDHELAGPARALEGRALAAEGRSSEAVDAFLRVPPRAQDSVRTAALEGIRAAAPELPMSALEARLREAPSDGWERLRAPLLAELALALHGRSRLDEAERRARAALELAADGPEAELARSVLDDEVTVDRRRSALLGSLLPAAGSPGEREYATLVLEGIEVRLEAGSGGGGVPVTLDVLDHGGQAAAAGEMVRNLVERGAAAILGPLGDAALEAAAAARTVPVPLVSPTARNLPPDAEAVYSLAGPDPEAPRTLARYAADRMLNDAVVLHADTRTSAFEAEAFAQEFTNLGGRVVRTLSYPPGSTFFEEQMQAVRELLPAALVLPIPASDIELLAPQITYFGLDTLGIQVLGTAEWAEPRTLETVEPRHTDGVVVATPRAPGRPTEAYERFVEDYETTLQKTLRSRIPALGYDAAGLLVEALRGGAREPRAVRRALEEIRDFEGATGTISVRGGRIIRDHRLVRLRNRELIPIRIDFDEEQERP